MSFKSLLIQISLIAILIVGVITHNEKLLNIYIVAIWLIAIFSLILLSLLTLILTSNNSEIKPEQSEKIKQTPFRNGNKLRKTTNILINVSSIVLIAYSGWTVTAVFYAISYLLSNFLIKISKEIIDKKLNPI